MNGHLQLSRREAKPRVANGRWHRHLVCDRFAKDMLLERGDRCDARRDGWRGLAAVHIEVECGVALRRTIDRERELDCQQLVSTDLRP
jgi:hypothetical protein